MARGQAYKFRRELTRYLAPGVTYDPLRQPLYDSSRQTATITAGTTISFFSTPIGQGTGMAGAAKTELDTNMRLAGQIPSQHVYECWSPRIVIGFDDVASANAPAVAQQASIINALLYGSFIRFKIVSQEKLLVPVFYLPAAAGAAGQLIQGFQAAAAAFQLAVVTNGTPSQISAQRLDPFPIVIPPLQTFTFELNVITAVTVAAAVAAIRLWVVLDGILHRPALP